jgi:hypothetical protein
MGNRSRHVSCRRLVLFAGVILLPGSGGGSKLEFHVNDPGYFRVLMAGKPGTSQQTVPSAAGQLSINSMESVDSAQIRRVAVYKDFPRPIVQSSDLNALLDGGIRGMNGNEQWAVQSQGPITLDGHPGREVRFAVDSAAATEKGTGRARIFLIGNRLYQAIMVGPMSKVSEEELDHFVKSFELVQKVAAIASTSPAALAAPAAGPAVLAQAAPPQPASPPIQAVRPTTVGQGAGPTVIAQDDSPQADAAEPTAGARGGGQTVVARQDPPPPARAMRTAPNRTPPARPTRGMPRTQAPAENQAVQAADSGPDPSKPSEAAIEVNKRARTLNERPAPNGNTQERFREVAPERGVLVGMRVGYVNAFGGSKVGAIQPIFQVGDTYSEGKQFGAEIPSSITVVARPGFAAGAINTRAGLLLDAFQVVFMRFKNGRLDTRDSYTSDWLGDPRGGGSGTATGQGKLVVGIHGRSNGREVNALGLLVAELPLRIPRDYAW